MGDRVETLEMTAQDGIVLRGRRFDGGPDAHQQRPVVCLAGLTRNGRDLNHLAETLSSGARSRTVYTFDMRGRGVSDFPSDWKSYTILRELNDVIDLMTAFGLFDVALVGTSRGGLLGLGLLAMQPTRIGALVLNDIGPVLEMDGIMRIAGYVGTTVTPASWDEAAQIVKRAGERHFAKTTDAEWEVIARQWFNEGANGEPTAGYDTNLSKTFEVPAEGLPELWPQFEAATRVPCLTIRGENSDILSTPTLERMAERHPKFRSFIVPDQGHAPLLRDEATLTAIRDFLDAADAERKTH